MVEGFTCLFALTFQHYYCIVICLEVVVIRLSNGCLAYKFIQIGIFDTFDPPQPVGIVFRERLLHIRCEVGIDMQTGYTPLYSKEDEIQPDYFLQPFVYGYRCVSNIPVYALLPKDSRYNHLTILLSPVNHAVRTTSLLR